MLGLNRDIELLRTEAKQGNASAQFRLGRVYDHNKWNRWVQQDHQEAVKWYQMAAEQGLTDAQYWLGLMYALGLSIPESPAKALEWLRMAAEEGYPEAQFYVGHAYTFDQRDEEAQESWEYLVTSRTLSS